MPLYLVILEVETDAVPAVIRLRAFLKRALRSWGFRAVEVRACGPDDDRPSDGRETALAGTPDGGHSDE